MQVNDYAQHINVWHSLALVEDDLRTAVATGNQRASVFASNLLRERFGVDIPPRSA